MSHPRQDQKQSQFADTGSAECGGDTESSGDLFQDKEQTEDGAEGGFAGRELIEVAAEDLTQGLDTSRSPGGEVGEGAGFDFALVPEGLAEEVARKASYRVFSWVTLILHPTEHASRLPH